ncbi:MAG: regulatory protein RecX [Xanthomonadales bacterium]|nr:regulatory protein RecX [Xanthomonadales bacterium]
MSDPVREAAIRLLARRERSAAELRTRLAAAGFPREAIERVLGELASEGRLSERRSAEAIARRAVARRRGPLWLRAELAARGVEGEAARACLRELDREAVDWEALARAALRGLAPRRGEEPRAFRARLARRLARRGFPASIIARVLGSPEEGGD